MKPNSKTIPGRIYFSTDPHIRCELEAIEESCSVKGCAKFKLITSPIVPSTKKPGDIVTLPLRDVIDPDEVKNIPHKLQAIAEDILSEFEMLLIGNEVTWESVYNSVQKLAAEYDLQKCPFTNMYITQKAYDKAYAEYQRESAE